MQNKYNNLLVKLVLSHNVITDVKLILNVISSLSLWVFFTLVHFFCCWCFSRDVNHHQFCIFVTDKEMCKAPKVQLLG